MNMKSLNTFLAVLALSIATTQGSVTTFYSSGANNGIVIPDGNPTGISSGIGVSGIGSVLNGLTLTINVSSGFNGDLLCYLNYGSSSVALLNRIGSTDGNPFGSATAGFTSFTFSDTGSSGLHSITGTAGSPLTGTYQPDGASLNTTFGGVNPNGDWTISFFDMASGGGSGPSTLESWSMSIDAVPEPVNVALGVFAGLGLIIIAGLSLWRKRSQAVA
jgi:subtilisin-like proprotein convertase family protein